MSRRIRLRRGDGVTVALAGWLAITALSQHPVRAFDGLRRPLLRTGLPLPDWRFFAPEPGRWDHHVMFRVVGDNGEPTLWQSVGSFERRRVRHALYFPTGRRAKALADSIGVLMNQVSGTDRDISEVPEYRMLRGFVEGHVRGVFGRDLPDGFQFLVLSDSGYDVGTELTMRLISRYERLERAGISDAEPA